MRVVVLIPGIMGTELILGGNKVWPPTLGEIQFGYNRVDDLASSNVQVGDLIRAISCYPVYQSLIDQLSSWGFAESSAGGAAGRLVCWPYDWRLDIRMTAAALARQLAQLVTEQDAGVEITLLPHSMGGLISRYALEVNDPQLGVTTWRDNVRLPVTMATPHRGTPLALVRALGIEGTLGVSAADVRKLAANPNYPSAYQLIPPAEAYGFWNRFGGGDALPSVDVFDQAVAGALGLNLGNIGAARDFYTALRGGSRPTHCRYFNFVGRKLDTVVRGDFVSMSSITPVSADDGGDGTVPVWSGTLPGTQFQLDGDEHARTFRNSLLLNTLGELLEVPPAEMLATTTPAPALQVSLPRQTFAPGAVARVTVQSTISSEIPLELAIHRLNERGERLGLPVATFALGAVQGGNIGVRTDVTLPLQAGLYGATPRSRDGTVEGPVEPFAIQQ